MADKNIYAHVVFGLPLEGHFDYLIPPHCAGRVAVGARVLVVFARRKRVGIVVGLAAASAFETLNGIIKVLDDAPVFDAAALVVARHFADRFCCSQGEALFLALPAYLRLARPLRIELLSPPAVHPGGTDRVDLIFDHSFARRWDSVAPRIKAVLEAGRGVLVLVPEASYLDETLPRLAPLAPMELRSLLRSGTEKDEFERWRKVKSGQARLVVGFLSAVFAPVQDLGLIVVLDEESPFYKSEQSPFTHAREAARLRASVEGAAVCLVSGSPSLEVMREVREGCITAFESPAALPPVRCLDLVNFKMKKGTSLSPVLCTAIEKTLAAGGKVLLYTQAARGAAPVLGELARRFPSAKTAGYDKASKVFPAEAAIIVGTQSILRYRASFRPALAALLDLDWELHKDDVRAAHIAFVLVRTLRQMAEREVIVQTRQASSPVLALIMNADPHVFYDAELAACREAGLPPYGALAAIIIRSVDPLLAEAEAGRLYDTMLTLQNDTVVFMEPQKDRTSILRGKFRWRIMAQARDAVTLSGILRRGMAAFRGKRDTVVTVNIDP